MSRNLALQTPLLVAALFACAAAQAATMSKVDYEAGKTRIGADYSVNTARCESFAGNANAVCIEEAKATQRVDRADLEYGYSGSASDRKKAMEERAESAYAVAKEKCGAKAGNDRDVCIQEASATKATAMSQIKMGKAISDARGEDAQNARDAEYKVAAQKCDAYSGDAKDSCMAAAKARFGKS